MRQPIIAGNWKMNKTVEESLELAKALITEVEGAEAEVVICPTFVSLSEVSKALKGTKIKVGAQNMHYKDSGAYTGEISPVFLKALGIEYVILGHSERRQYFKELNEEISYKVKAALSHGIRPILCVGETIEERERGKAFETIRIQLHESLEGVVVENADDVIIAYEPIWAIGTGKTATKEDANEVIGFIRNELAEKYGKDTSDRMRILYGGSVKSSNIKELMSMPDIDGALVGGASLDALEFSKIVNYK